TFDHQFLAAHRAAHLFAALAALGADRHVFQRHNFGADDGALPRERYLDAAALLDRLAVYRHTAAARPRLDDQPLLMQGDGELLGALDHLRMNTNDLGLLPHYLGAQALTQ